MRSMTEILHAKEIVERALTHAIERNAPRGDILALSGPVGTLNWLLELPEGNSMQEMIERVDQRDKETRRDDALTNEQVN